eukprot:7283395-Lingulodinium_polyedra.AAC.1
MLIPRGELPAGPEFVVPRGGSGHLGTFGADAPSFITFDGGTRSIDGHSVAAGVAIAWGRAEQ